jgi:glyoxylase-like metal-dependent hydrolase (beta-lactamase superfamily II)
MQQIAPDVYWLGFTVSNAYLVGDPKTGWVVIDTGTPGHFDKIKNAATDCFGEDARPEAVLLTHGHADHYGSALALATYWGVPVYAHRREAPYLTGKATLPPPDPTVGGAFGLAARVMPPSGTDLGDAFRVLPDDGSVPGLPGWCWHHTPGHTPGHVSFFRESDRTLIAGDAVLTVNTDSVMAVATKKQQLAPPAAAATSDWEATRASMRLLAGLRPALVAAGHGVPMSDPDGADDLAELAERFRIPEKGRYVPEPAVADDDGIAYLPPPAPDPLPKVAAGVALVAALVGVGVWASKRRKGSGDGEA